MAASGPGFFQKDSIVRLDISLGTNSIGGDKWRYMYCVAKFRERQVALKRPSAVWVLTEPSATPILLISWERQVALQRRKKIV